MSWKRFSFGVLLIGLLCGSATAQEGIKFVLLGNKQSEAQLRLVPAEDGAALNWQVMDLGNGGTTSVAMSSMVRVGTLAPLANGELIVLESGRVRADAIAIHTEQVDIGDASGLDRLRWKTSRVPRAELRGILFQPPSDPQERWILLREIQTEPRDEDILLLRNGSRLLGKVLTRKEAEGGEGLGHFELSRSSDKPPLAIPTEKVVAWMQAGKPSPMPTSGMQIGFADGSLLHVQKLVPAKKIQAGEPVRLQNVQLMLETGTKLTVDLAAEGTAQMGAFHQSVYLRPWNANVRSLTALKPPSTKTIPWLTTPSGAAQEWPVRMDESLLGGELVAAKQRFEKGIGMHSASRAVFDLERGFKAFVAELAIDDSAAAQGSVVGEVLLQRPSGKWESVFQSRIVRQGEDPQAIMISLGDAVRLALAIDYADGGDVGDHALWLDPRLEK